MLSLVTILTSVLAVSAAPAVKRGGGGGYGQPPKDSNDKNCLINGISILDCSDINVSDVLSGNWLDVLKRDDNSVVKRCPTCDGPPPSTGHGEDKSCFINGISLLDCSTLDLSNILSGNSISIAKRGGGGSWGEPQGKSDDKNCFINGLSVLDCSDIKVSDVLSGNSVNILKRGQSCDWCDGGKPQGGNEKSCNINGISILDCTDLNLDDILSGNLLGIL